LKEAQLDSQALRGVNKVELPNCALGWSDRQYRLLIGNLACARICKHAERKNFGATVKAAPRKRTSPNDRALA